MKQTGTRLTDSSFEQLQNDAEKRGTTVSDLIRSIVVEHYDNEAEKAELLAIKTSLAVVAETVKNLASTTGQLAQHANIQANFRTEVRKALNIQQAQSAQQKGATV